jgi:hypothetical protein
LAAMLGEVCLGALGKVALPRYFEVGASLLEGRRKIAVVSASMRERIKA